MSQNISPVKINASQYYIHRSYVNSYYYIYIFLEDWISHNIFRKDSSRVFMASPEYAFRRRFELTDMSESFDKIEASSLNFPFANYWPQNSGWINDDRIASNTAAQIYDGLYIGNTKLRAASVIHKIPVSFYFDREDDARMTYSNLFFFTYNRHNYKTKVPYTGNSLELPIVLNINNLVFNPSFKESDWLQKQRIFIVTAEFECRSYIVKPPEQPLFGLTVDENGYLSDGSGLYDDGYQTYYIVDDVILNLTNQNWKLETYEGVNKSFPKEGKVGVIYTDSDIESGYPTPQMYIWVKGWVDPEDPSKPPKDTYVPINSKYLSTTTEADALRYSELLNDPEITFKQFGQPTWGKTQTSATITWEFEDDVAFKDYEEILDKEKIFEYTIPENYSIIKFYINGNESLDYTIKDNTVQSKEKLPIGTNCKVRYYLLDKIGVYTENGTSETFLDPDETMYLITNLTPDSSYLIYVNFYMVNGKTKKLGCKVLTAKSNEPITEKTISTNQLIGISW